MITAKEASNLAELSEIELNKIFDMINIKIVEFATIGKRSLNLTEEFPSWGVFKVDKLPYTPARLTDRQKSIELGFISKGYTFKIIEKTFDITKSYGYMPDNDEPEKMVSNYSFEIKW